MQSTTELQQDLETLRNTKGFSTYKEARLIDQLIVAKSIEILEEDNPITVRRLHYLLAQKLSAEYKNNLKQYDKLTSLITIARRKGDVPYEWIADPTRAVHTFVVWNNVAKYAESARSWYERDRWQSQDTRVEVWVEKDSLLSVLHKTCMDYQVTLRSLHGQGSNTLAYETAKAIAPRKKNEKPQHPDKKFHVLYFGDMDPCGEQIPTTFKDSVEQILENHFDYYNGIELHRLGFNYDDFETVNVESIDNKPKDKQLAGYLARHGEDAKFAEVEALPKSLMIERIELELRLLIDNKAWAKETKQETLDKKKITAALKGLK